mmetsp:Transcript_14945/g.45088  ORF Transcript_14945/g.45088 Transcript_14945/m.45088 type:complete len:266 (+) Transcript_14945:1302-2099(+)
MSSTLQTCQLCVGCSSVQREACLHLHSCSDHTAHIHTARQTKVFCLALVASCSMQDQRWPAVIPTAALPAALAASHWVSRALPTGGWPSIFKGICPLNLKGVEACDAAVAVMDTAASEAAAAVATAKLVEVAPQRRRLAPQWGEPSPRPAASSSPPASSAEVMLDTSEDKELRCCSCMSSSPGCGMLSCVDLRLVARGGLGGVAEEVRRDRRLLPPQSAHWGSIRAALWPLRGKALAGFTTRHPGHSQNGSPTRPWLKRAPSSVP